MDKAQETVFMQQRACIRYRQLLYTGQPTMYNGRVSLREREKSA